MNGKAVMPFVGFRPFPGRPFIGRRHDPRESMMSVPTSHIRGCPPLDYRSLVQATRSRSHFKRFRSSQILIASR